LKTKDGKKEKGPTKLSMTAKRKKKGKKEVSKKGAKERKKIFLLLKDVSKRNEGREEDKPRKLEKHFLCGRTRV